MTRAEKRRLEREKRKLAKRKGGRPMPVVAPSQKGLMFAIFLLIFSITCLAFVVGMDGWMGGGYYKLFGYFIIALTMGGGVGLWFKTHKHFHHGAWPRRLSLLLLAGMIGGYVFTSFIEGIIKATRWTQTQTDHVVLLEAVKQWGWGDTFDQQTCQKLGLAQDQLIASLWQHEIPPMEKQVDLAVYGEKVLYQAGCSGRFVYLEEEGKKGYKKWSEKYPIQEEKTRMHLNYFWPDIEEGCFMEKTRSFSLREEEPDCDKKYPDKTVDWEAYKN